MSRDSDEPNGTLYSGGFLWSDALTETIGINTLGAAGVAIATRYSPHPSHCLSNAPATPVPGSGERVAQRARIDEPRMFGVISLLQPHGAHIRNQSCRLEAAHEDHVYPES